MNARIPAQYTGPTSNPWADYERWADRADYEDEVLQARQAQARSVVLAGLATEEWRELKEIGGVYTSPDELLLEALEAEDAEVLRLYNELMTSPGALQLRDAIAGFHGNVSPWMGD